MQRAVAEYKPDGTINSYNLFVKYSPVSVAMVDVNLNYIACSSKWISLVNLPDDCATIENQCLFHSLFNTNQSFKTKCFDSLSGVTYQNQEGLFFNGSTSFRWIVYHLQPFRDENGEIEGLIIYAEDVTSQKLLSPGQKENFEVDDFDFEESSLGIIHFDLQGKCLKINTNVSELLGYSKDATTTAIFTEKISHKEDRQVIPNAISELLKDSKKNYAIVEHRFLDAYNHTIHAILFICLRKDSKGEPIYLEAQLVDVYSKTSATTTDLHPAFMDMEAIFKASTNVIIVLTDKNGIIREFNAGAERILGYTKEEVIGKHSPEIFHCDKELELKGKALSAQLCRRVSGFSVFSELAQNRSETEEWVYKRKNGNCFPVRLTLNTVEDANGEIVGYLGVAQDVSDLKNKEVEVEKLLAISKKQHQKLLNFTHIVSHNIKSQSSNIAMLLDAYYDDLSPNNSKKTIELLSQTSSKLSETIYYLNQILNINSISKSDLKNTNLWDTVKQSVDNNRDYAIRNKVAVITDINRDIEVLAPPGFLENIIEVFVVNAIQFSQNKADSFVKLNAAITKEYVILEVQDNGLGINMELYREKLFGMYQTFHNQEKSRGLGLFMVKNQIDAIGGKIEVSSEVEVGTTFKMYLKYE